eukprot:1334809-Alexandrium_andersonii.AAC.1
MGGKLGSHCTKRRAMPSHPEARSNRATRIARFEASRGGGSFQPLSSGCGRLLGSLRLFRAKPEGANKCPR